MFKSAGHEAWKSKDRSYDLNVALEVPLYGTHRIKAECKLDKVALSTENIALEVESDNKPSGIHPGGPNPDLWIHGIGNEVWLMKTKAIHNGPKIKKSWKIKILMFKIMKFRFYEVNPKRKKSIKTLNLLFK